MVEREIKSIPTEMITLSVKSQVASLLRGEDMEISGLQSCEAQSKSSLHDPMQPDLRLLLSLLLMPLATLLRPDATSTGPVSRLE